MYVPNDYVFDLVKEHPNNFLPSCSVHPYRKDAIEELERCHAAGARLIKWLPNSMGIDPSSDLCEPYYRKVAELGMIILSHCGEEKVRGFFFFAHSAFGLICQCWGEKNCRPWRLTKSFNSWEILSCSVAHSKLDARLLLLIARAWELCPI